MNKRGEKYTIILIVGTRRWRRGVPSYMNEDEDNHPCPALSHCNLYPTTTSSRVIILNCFPRFHCFEDSTTTHTWAINLPFQVESVGIDIQVELSHLSHQKTMVLLLFDWVHCVVGLMELKSKPNGSNSSWDGLG